MNNIICTDFVNSEIKQPVYVKQFPYVDDVGLWEPVNEYVLEGQIAVDYRLVMSREMFVEAYNKWIRSEQDD